jgi:hypothetical protein
MPPPAQHARAHVVVRLGIQDQVIERLRIAVEKRCDDAVAGFGDGIAEHPIQRLPAAAQQAGRQPVGGRFAPFGKQVEGEEQHLGGCVGLVAPAEVVIKFFEQPARHRLAVRPCRLHRRGWKTEALSEAGDDAIDVGIRRSDRLCGAVRHVLTPSCKRA